MHPLTPRCTDGPPAPFRSDRSLREKSPHGTPVRAPATAGFPQVGSPREGASARPSYLVARRSQPIEPERRGTH